VNYDKLTRRQAIALAATMAEMRGDTEAAAKFRKALYEKPQPQVSHVLVALAVGVCVLVVGVAAVCALFAIAGAR